MICPLLDLCDIMNKACEVDVRTAGEPELEFMIEIGLQSIGYLALGMRGRTDEQETAALGGEVYNACIRIERFIKRRRGL